MRISNNDTRKEHELPLYGNVETDIDYTIEDNDTHVDTSYLEDLDLEDLDIFYSTYEELDEQDIATLVMLLDEGGHSEVLRAIDCIGTVQVIGKMTEVEYTIDSFNPEDSKELDRLRPYIDWDRLARDTCMDMTEYCGCLYIIQ